MRYFWTLPAIIRVALVLAAQHHQFSPNEDLLAYPQYDILWSEDYVTEELAASKLQHTQRKELYSHTSSDQQDVERYRPPADSRDKLENGDEVYYEEMTLQGARYLCAIPDIEIEDSEHGTTNDTLSKQDEEKELARANTRGWELMADMQGSCIYYNENWWSYSFCYNNGVRQFHQLAQTKGTPTWPPVEDPNVNGFMLGVFPKDSKSKTKQAKGQDVSTSIAAPTTGELVVKGDTKYLKKKLDGGDVCDLTQKSRSIEVQFHCNPAVAIDYISLLKEVSTCTYLMIVQTPKLCNDIAFMPPQKDQPNDIICRPILAQDSVKEYEESLKLINNQDERIQQEEQQDIPPLRQQIVGDIVVGGHNIVPKDLKLEKSALFGGKWTFVATVATSDGKTLPEAEIKKLSLDPKGIEKLKKDLHAMAGGRGWKLDVIDTTDGREYRGIIDADDEDDDESTQEDNEGSKEEFFKEEL